MSSERQGGVIVFHCDTCPEVCEGESSDFREEWAAARREGWTAAQIGSEWTHHCPACSEDL